MNISSLRNDLSSDWLRAEVARFNGCYLLDIKLFQSSAEKYRFVLFFTCAALRSGGTTVW
jgi:hypothetical protein